MWFNKYRIAAIIPYFALFSFFGVQAQQNTNFEEPINFDSMNFISNWNIWLHNASGMIDNSGAYEGENGLCVEPIDDTKQFSVDAGMYIPAYFFKNDDIQFNIKIDSKNTSIDSIIFKISDTKDSKKITEFNESQISEWTSYLIPFKLSSNRVSSAKFIFRIYARSGHFKVDDFNIIINSKIVTANKWHDFQDQNLVAELKNLIISVDDFIKSDALKEPSSVVGIGENSHGIKECKKLRYDIISELSDLYPINILVEQPPIELAILNNNLKNKAEGLIKDEINQLFFVYRSVHFENLVKDVANGNFTNNIEFHGVDLQYENFDFDFLKNNDIYLTDSSTTVIKRSISKWKEIKSSLHLSFFRDSLMATNIHTLHDPYRKNIFLGHNYHVKNEFLTTGHWLDKTLKEKYINIGVLIGVGNHTARNVHDHSIIKTPIPPILPNSYESIFNKVSEQPFVLEMNTIKSNPVIYNQLCPRVMTEASASHEVTRLSHYILDITDEYDYIVYFPTVEAMNLIE